VRSLEQVAGVQKRDLPLAYTHRPFRRGEPARRCRNHC
jgi:hypothetical protein